MASITERRNADGKLISYKVRVYRGRDADGKQLKPWQTTFEVKPSWSESFARKEAEKFAAQFESDCKGHRVALDGTQTFQQFAAYYIELKARRSKPSTIADYKRICDRVCPIIGNRKLKDITVRTLNDLYGKLMQEGQNKRTGGTLSNRTIRRYHTFIYSVLAQAYEEELIPTNPAKKVKKDLPKATKRDINALQTADIDAVKTALQSEPDKWRTLILLLLNTGMRRGEAIGLKWNAVDFKNNVVNVRNNIVYISGVGAIDGTPKSKQSIRAIPVPKEMTVILRHWKESEMLRLKDSFHNDGYVFPVDLTYVHKEPTESGVYVLDNLTPMHPDSVTSWLTKFCKRHDLPHIHPHQLRHTFATQLLAAGIDVATLSNIMGHERPSTTSDIYCHGTSEAFEEVRLAQEKIYYKNA